MQPIIVLDTRTQIIQGENKGRYHVKIKLSIPVVVGDKKEWVAKRAKTFVYATEDEFKSIMGTPRAQDLKAKKEAITAVLRKAEDVAKISGLTPKQYLMLVESSGNFESVTGVFDFLIAKMEKEERDGNASALQSAKSFFITFKGSSHIAFNEITVEWLDACKAWAKSSSKDEKGKVLKKEHSMTTFYIYCRALRSVLKYAAKKLNKITEESIPFGKDKFKIPGSKKKNRKVKLQLAKDELTIEKNKILNFVAEDPRVRKALNYWKALFFCNGCNMADLAYLKFRDMQDGTLMSFERKKTKNTEDDNEPIHVLITPQLQQIIREEGNKSLDPDEYIFPILKRGLDSKRRRATIKQFTKITNQYLDDAIEPMKLNIPLTTGSARYVMSTLLRRYGIDLSAIKDMLGHESESTTEHYADGLDIDLRKMIAKILAS